ncbi:hypothetical protein Glove_184g76 [Diversispora epigaea]|uniref:DUF3752 domain-containing protein n=1 Tax=Diversispora epigaea TaxID=1348612 RepID=A0A397IMM6_9GLOM|nr:hypothetical protein Glove_184g76 [Diversispora epigaea]
MSEEIGPQIPENLVPKFQKEDSNDEESAPSPDIGPQSDADNIDKTRLDRETQRSNSNNNIGFTTPKVSSNFEEQEENIEDIDAYLPALPPDILAERRRKKEEQEKKTSGIKETAYKRQIGPATMPLNIKVEDQNSEEEEIIGPVFPKDLDENDDKYALERTIQEFEERSERMRSSLEDEKSEKQSGRGEWMLVPPPQIRYLESPGNMKSRQFSQKTHDPKLNDNSLWTETPAEKQERLKSKSSSTQKRKREEEEPVKYSESDLENSKKIKEFNEIHRPKSLLEEHSEKYLKSKKWKDDDVRNRPFDREKDVLGPRRMDSRKRQEILENAKELSSKFYHGKHGSFL